MASQSLLRSNIHTRRDVLLFRLQVRQLARILGFSPLEQIELCTEAFNLALAARKARPQQQVCARLEEHRLILASQGFERKGDKNIDGGRFVVDLPRATEFCAEDVAFIVAQLGHLLEIDVLEVIREQNEQIASLLEALRCCRRDLERVGSAGSRPSAA